LINVVRLHENITKLEKIQLKYKHTKCNLNDLSRSNVSHSIDQIIDWQHHHYNVEEFEQITIILRYTKYYLSNSVVAQQLCYIVEFEHIL
jgi:hypothetical protein